MGAVLRQVLARACAGFILVAGAAACAATVTPTPSATPTAAPTATQTPIPSPSPTLPATFVVQGWGELWAAPPPWFIAPGDARLVHDPAWTESFTTALDPQHSLGSVIRLFEANAFSVESLAAGQGPDGPLSAYFSGTDEQCEALVTASPHPAGSLVQIRYPTTCPW